MADRRGIIVPLLILAFIFLSPDPVRQSRQQFDHRPTLQDVITEEQRALSEVQNSTYRNDRFAKPDAIGLNLTGLEPERGYSWEPLPLVQNKARTWLGHTLGEEDEAIIDGVLDLDLGGAQVYKNVTGFVHGKWVQSKLETPITSPTINLSDYAIQNPFNGRTTLHPFGRNITGDGGDIRLRFHERQAPLHDLFDVETANATPISMEVTISEEESGNEHEFRVYGVYFPTLGQAVLTTTSDKFAGVFALPHLAMSGATFEESRRVMNESILRSIQRQIDGETESHNPWTSRLEGDAAGTPFSFPQCELVFYLQQLDHPGLPETDSISFLNFLERELRFPTGAFLPPAPPIRFAMAAFSPDCGFMLESVGPPDHAPQEGDHLNGPKIESLHLAARHHILLFTATLSAQLLLLIRQMRDASTPSTRSRLSLYTFAMLSLGDGFTTMAFMLISLFIGGLWVNLVATAFVAFMSVSFFGMRFLMDIWTVQAPEREQARREEAEEERRREVRFREVMERLRSEREERLRQEREHRENAEREQRAQAAIERQEAAATIAHQPEQQTPATDETTPAPPPTTAPAPAPPSQPPANTGEIYPFFMPSDQAGLLPTTALPDPNRPLVLPPESFASLYTRFYLLLLATLFISLNAASWSPVPRRVYFTTVGFVYLGFWIPQIARNVGRNCRKAVRWEFVLGQSALRLTPFLYFYGYGGNVLFAERDYISLAILGGWLWFQILTLASQEFLGARWFVGRKWVSEAWDYHPVLREDEEGATMPVGWSREEEDKGPESPMQGRGSIDDGARRASVSSGKDGMSKPVEAEGRKADNGRRIFDCAICMQTLEVPVIPAGGSADSTSGGGGLSGPAGLLARRQYMVTPCRHIFHAPCLEGWMKYRLICPVCREGVPAL
ncbi:uncharacterized protein LTR77_007391 [Saxophila tyrrhenica]|uniref:DSC E3 ubiquitin ligase complex subunit A n=1 Tax=Saxophila tyrrhenica TaxID=1690608 RepID=A0AAV9P7H9_9PEZI|nr:hypothetical protein LTR77_007391 [Saxophila tyrrhenica]